MFENSIYQKILRGFFALDAKMLFILKEPDRYPAKVCVIKILSNIIFYFKEKRNEECLKTFIFFFYYIFINILKIFYFPVSILFYFSKYKFAQPNFSQVGVLNEHLNYMIKDIYNRKKIPVVFLPRCSKFSFIKKLFLNIIFIDNIFLLLLLTPLRHTKFCTMQAEEVDYFLDKKGFLIKPKIHSKIINNFNKNFLFYNDKSKNPFKFNENFLDINKIEIPKIFKNIDLKKTYIFHHRQKHYKGTSDLRGAELESYIKAIKFLISQEFNIIRLVNNNDESLTLDSKFYYELNIDEDKNKLIQFFLIYKAKGYIGTSSGPVSIASILNKPILETNVWGQHVNGHNDQSTFIMKKIKKNDVILNYKSLIDLNYYRGEFQNFRKFKRDEYIIINNTEEEILDAFKYFFKINHNSIPDDELQIKFKESLPDYMDMKHLPSRIVPEFLSKNKEIFKGLIY